MGALGHHREQFGPFKRLELIEIFVEERVDVVRAEHLDIVAHHACHLAHEGPIAIHAAFTDQGRVNFLDLVARVFECFAGGIQRLFDLGVEVEFKGVLGKSHFDGRVERGALPRQRNMEGIARIGGDHTGHGHVQILRGAGDQALHGHGLRQHSAFGFLAWVIGGDSAKARLDGDRAIGGGGKAQRAADVVASCFAMTSRRASTPFVVA